MLVDCIRRFILSYGFLVKGLIQEISNPHFYLNEGQGNRVDSLLKQCQQNQDVAWNRLFKLYADSVYRWALHFGIDPAGAEEVSQEVFTTIFKKISTCESDKQLSVWIFQITRRLAANYRRNLWFKSVMKIKPKEKKETEIEYMSEAARTDEKPCLSIEVKQCLEKIPVKLLEVLIMHDLDGYNRQEISEHLNIPEGTVASRLAKARNTYKKLSSGSSKWKNS